MGKMEAKERLDRALENIEFTKLRLKFKAIEEIHISEYKGSAFRGCFGESFRKVVCKYPSTKCELCRLLYNCEFSKLFATPLQKDHHLYGKYTYPPRPYIIIPMEGKETILRPNDIFYFDIILIGSAIQIYPIIPDIAKAMGKIGIGSKHSKFTPISIKYYTSNGLWNTLPAIGAPSVNSVNDMSQKPINNIVTIQFQTPVRFLKQRKPHKEEPSFDLFIDNLSKRVSLLSHLYCGSEWVNTDRAFIFEDSVKIKSSNLNWTNWSRYSGTKDKIQYYDGHIGEITYEGDFKPWSQLLNLGTILHSGSTATFGLGRYSIINHE